MKKYSTICLLILSGLFFSCSNDKPEDEPTEQQTEPETEEEIIIDDKILLETVQKIYDKDSGDLEGTYKNIFENNRITKTEYYNASEELTYYNNWEFNVDGALSKLTGYKQGGILDYESTLTYDDSKRLIHEEKSELNGTYITVVDITYNSDNTITRTKDANGSIQTLSYFLNDKNIIYREQSQTGSILAEAVYDENNNVLSMNNEETMYTYYDQNIEKKGAFFFNYLGGNGNNLVLWNGSLRDQVEVYSLNHVETITYSSGNNNKVLEFDDDNYLLKSTSFSNGILYSITDLIYQE